MRLNIVIPTFKRAHKLPGKDYFKTAKYVLPESQRDDYLKVLPAARMIVIPDECDGCIPRKRNWILKNIERPLLMMDDDVKRLMMTEGMHEVKAGSHKRATEKTELTPHQASDVIIQGFNLAHQWGCVLWGINVNTDGRNYQQYKPFALTQVVLGPFQGHLEHNLLYDERMGSKDDYDFSLQVLCHHKKIMRFNKYAYDCEHGFNQGGIVSMRTFQSELADCRAIERKWGRRVISYPMEPKSSRDLLNGRVNVPIAGV